MPSELGFTATEVDYVKRVSTLYAYVYSEPDPLRARELLALAYSTLPHEAGLRALLQIFDQVGEFPTYDFLLERGLATLPWRDVSALAGSPNRADAEVTVSEARWMRASIDFRNELDAARDAMGKSDFDAVLAKLYSWQKKLVDAAKPPSSEQTLMDIYREQKEKHGGIQFFVKRLDDAVKGCEPGSLTVVGGFANAGKTTFALNMAYCNAVKYGISSVYVTFEVPAKQLKLAMLARHSLSSKFSGKPFDRMDVQKALLGEADEARLEEVADDWEHGDYGRVKILGASDFPHYTLESIVERVRAERPYQAVFIDYINVFQNFDVKGVEGQYQKENYFVRGLFNELALKSDPQVPVVVLAQIKRTAYDQYVAARAAGEPGGYSLGCFAEANELDRAPYYDVALFSDDDLIASGLLRAQLIKSKGPMIHKPFDVKFEPSHLFVGDDDFAGVGVDSAPLGVALDDLVGGG